MDPFEKKAPKAPETFAEALLEGLDLSHLPQLAETRGPPRRPAATLTEKSAVLESLSQFAHEELQQSTDGVVRFPGGELVARTPAPQPAFAPQCASAADFARALEARIGALTGEALREGKQGPPLVLFLGEALRSDAVAAALPQVRAEFLVAFDPSVAELFQRMVQAMRLTTAEYQLTALQDHGGERPRQLVLEEIFWQRPRVVVPLGARATSFLLGNRERLTSAHGKFFPLAEIPGVEVFPLFHPSVILNNANMKKSTWADMQKLMGVLGKG